MDSSAETIQSALLAWYDEHARTLPWRSPPGMEPPQAYRVWLAEVMLQQTTTTAVAPYYAKFLDRWPTVAALAAADDGDVMAAWAGLGYYARARNLLACARAVMAMGGGFPASEAELRRLPGLGAYTAASIAAIAFGEASTVVDANVERVVARLYAIDVPLRDARKAIRKRADALTPAKRPGDFAQAMMDLGATICTPRNPRCLLCPLSDPCEGRIAGPERFPAKSEKRPRRLRSGQAFWIEKSGSVWLITRPAKGMLGGMRALPDDGWSARADGHKTPPIPGPWRPAGTVSHGFTHFDLDLQLMLYSGDDCFTLERDGQWWPIDRIDQAGLPTLFAKAGQLALALRPTQAAEAGES